MSENGYEIPPDGEVLACIDASVYADSVADHAAWAAQRLGAPLQFLHVLDRKEHSTASADYSGNIGLEAQAELLQELVELDQKRSRLSAEHGRLLLARARERAAGAGLAAAGGLQRHGSLVETLAGLESGTRLFVVGKRGEAADFDKGHLGGNLERVARAVHRPLLVASRAFRAVERFAIAFDGSPTTRKCVQMVAQSPLVRGLPCHLVSAGDGGGALAEAQARARALLAAAGFEVEASIVPGEAESVIGGYVREHGIDLLVMGAYGHSRVRQLIVGSTTTAMLRSCRVPVLLLR
ncbi:universal stress protein [Luteimonas sp. RD2P54]|uniref:Universal stress protein n=1 Tax=Luteimonas endophytica TaxID=3042023 RepID=A0ABT6J9U2_9GAMM|nr:universal stress protein [Luteimonas endophytica]MDH5823357.1 universal stress protein [Luteimonas endophytica]